MELSGIQRNHSGRTRSQAKSVSEGGRQVEREGENERECFAARDPTYPRKLRVVLEGSLHASGWCTQFMSISFLRDSRDDKLGHGACKGCLENTKGTQQKGMQGKRGLRRGLQLGVLAWIHEPLVSAPLATSGLKVLAQEVRQTCGAGLLRRGVLQVGISILGRFCNSSESW